MAAGDRPRRLLMCRNSLIWLLGGEERTVLDLLTVENCNAPTTLFAGCEALISLKACDTTLVR